MFKIKIKEKCFLYFVDLEGQVLCLRTLCEGSKPRSSGRNCFCLLYVFYYFENILNEKAKWQKLYGLCFLI